MNYIKIYVIITYTKLLGGYVMINQKHLEELYAYIDDKKDDIIKELSAVASIKSVSDATSDVKPFGQGCLDALYHMLKKGEEEGFETKNWDNYVGHILLNNGAKENIGVEQLKSEMQNCVCAFSGNSGVGKSSILNALFPELQLKTGEVSDKLGRGRHTTRHTELFFVGDGAYVVDTPGFSTVETQEDLYDFKLALPECFPDFSEYLGCCKFTSCSHTTEKGCAVIEAVKDGSIQKSRHQSFVALSLELKDVTAWNNKSK